MLNNNISLFQRGKRTLRILIAYTLYLTGVLERLARIRLKGNAVVLIYHRILESHEISQSYSREGIIVSKETFNSQMKYLKENFNAISMSNLVERLKNKIPFEEKTCLITFDDGWKDNFKNAYPVLKKLGIPAAIFLATDFIASRKRFWQERLTELLIVLHERCQGDQQFREKALDEFLEVKGLREIILSSEKNLKEQISLFVSMQKGTNEKFTEDLIQKLRHFLGLSPNYFDQAEEFLNWDEIKTMTEDGIDFGSHGKSHIILTQKETKVVQQEIGESKGVFQEKLGMTITSFSYANGEYSEEIVNMVEQNGYEAAFGTERGFVSLNDNPYKLRRINIHEDMTQSIPMFLSRIVGLW